MQQNDPAVSELLDTEYDKFVRNMAEFFIKELNDLDEEIEKDDIGFIMTSGNKPTSDSGSNDEDQQQKKKSSKNKLHALAHMILCNINSGKDFRPKRNNKLVDAMNRPLDPSLSRIPAKVNSIQPKCYIEMLRTKSALQAS